MENNKNMLIDEDMEQVNGGMIKDTLAEKQSSQQQGSVQVKQTF